MFPVSYADKDGTHPLLEALYELKYGLSFDFVKWDIWKHFFKPYEYREEKEVRILYQYVPQATKATKEWHNNGNMVFPLVKFCFPDFLYHISSVARPFISE